MILMEPEMKGISSFYEDIYRKSPEELPDLSNCIENLLGDKVLINPLVTNSELSKDELDLLERP
jgi:hypothetical protein